MEEADIAVVGAGAAGLFAAIWAARTNRKVRVIAFDGAKRIGAKILISGGGRCNVTHHQVEESAFAGSTPPAIRKVLKRFTVQQTVQFFRSSGVHLKQEETGKLFPVTDRAETVLDALLRAAEDAGVSIRASHRVEMVRPQSNAFIVSGPWGQAKTHRVVLATGGRSVPKTGSDGYGFEIATSLGHTLTSRIFPALVPLLLDATSPFRRLSGISATVELRVESAAGRVIRSFRNSMLFTHVGVSGPAVLDISRYYIDAKQDDPATKLTVNWLPDKTSAEIDQHLQQIHRSTIGSWLRKQFPDRLAEVLYSSAQVAPDTPGHQLTREQRIRLIQTITHTILPVTGDRGFAVAEVTAGGVPLKEVRLDTMESRQLPGLYLCGEICDVDGRIGGFNFQWAWASGYVAGISAALNTETQGHGD